MFWYIVMAVAGGSLIARWITRRNYKRIINTMVEADAAVKDYVPTTDDITKAQPSDLFPLALRKMGITREAMPVQLLSAEDLKMAVMSRVTAEMPGWQRWLLRLELRPEMRKAMDEFTRIRAEGVNRPVRARRPEPMVKLEDLLEWLKSDPQSTPKLWHHVVADLNYDVDETWDILEWIMQQPNCDAGTVRKVLTLTDADFYQTNAVYEGTTADLLEVIAARLENGGYAAPEFTCEDWVYDPESYILENQDTRPWRTRILLSLMKLPKGTTPAKAPYRVQEDGLHKA